MKFITRLLLYLSVALFVAPVLDAVVHPAVSITSSAQAQLINSNSLLGVSKASEFDVYPSTSIAFRAGTSSNPDYYSFCGAKSFSNGNEIFGFRLGSDHNSSADGNIYVVRYTAGVVSSNILIHADDGTHNYTNVSVGVGAGNRAFVFWLRLKAATGAELTGPGDLFYKYSDDFYNAADPTTAAWSSVQRLTTDHGELNTTSTTSINLSSLVAETPLTFTIGTGITDVVIGRFMNIASSSDPTNKHVQGPVTAYNSGTGSVTINISQIFGSTTHTDWLVSMTSYIDGPGDMIVMSNGDLLHPVWTTFGFGTTVSFYKSTAASNGLAWTLQGSVPQNVTNPQDETGVTQLLDDRLLAIIRCNTLSVYQQSFSSDYGVTWSTETSTGITGQGKIALDVSPAGKVSGILRGADGRTSLFQNTSDTFTNWSYEYVDNRSVYMYGGYFWSTTLSKFIGYYTVEATNGVGYQGPTIALRKEFEQSATYVAPPPIYDSEYQNLLDYGEANGEATPNSTLRAKHNTLVAALRSAGKLTMVSEYYVTKHNDATLSAISKRNWRKPWQTLTVVGSPTYGVNGFDFDGIDDYIFAYTPLINDVNFLQNNASVIYYTDDATDGVSFGVGDGSYSTRTDAAFLSANSSDAYAKLNDSGGPASASSGGATGLWELDRSGSANFLLIKNGTTLATLTATSTGKSSQPLHVGAERFSDDVYFFSPRGFGLIGLGGSKASWYTEWLAYISSL